MNEKNKMAMVANLANEVTLAIKEYESAQENESDANDEYQQAKAYRQDMLTDLIARRRELNDYLLNTYTKEMNNG